MEYPLIIDGESAGSLTAEEEGLYIVFSARTRARGELTRLWLHGAGGEEYLGIMSPAGEELCLERRISKRTLGALWQEAEYASNRSGEEERACAEEESPEEESAEEEAMPMPGEENEEENDGAEQEPDETKRESDESESAETDGETQAGQEEEDGLIWYRTESGTLTAFDGKRRLTALPVRLRHGNERVELRTIEGREYMIF